MYLAIVLYGVGLLLIHTHGLFPTHTLVEENCVSDSSRLNQLNVTFKRPVGHVGIHAFWEHAFTGLGILCSD